MTLDEAIKNEEEIAIQQIEKANALDNIPLFGMSKDDIEEIKECYKCTKEHEQRAEWLKDYKRLLEQEPKWIPVSERLPEKDESVLLTICANGSLYGFNENFVKVMCGSYSPCEDKRDWIVNEIRYYIDNVIAWMPLPEPYKAEREDKYGYRRIR